MTETSDQPDQVRGGELVLPERPRAALPARRWPAAVVALRARVAELARDPVVVATVGAGLAASALRYAASSGSGRGSAGSVVVTGFVLQHVHVVHHVVHHVVVETDRHS